VATTTKPQVFRTSFVAYRGYLNQWDGHQGKLILWLVPAMVVVLFVTGIFGGAGYLLPILGTTAFALAGLVLLLMFRLARVTASPGRLEVRNPFGFTRVVTGDDLGPAVMIDDYTVPMGVASLVGGVGISLPRLLILNSRGKPALSWLSAFWTPRQMKKLTAALGLEMVAVRRKDVRQHYPNAVPLWTTHIWITAFIVVGIIIVLGGAAIAITIAVQHS
jgi:hypothetical protein